jgi:FkbM family methyltransferase
MELGALYSRAQKALSTFVERPLSGPRWDGRKVVIYGAGGFGRDLARALRQQKINVLGFLDQKGHGQIVVADLRAYAPESPQAKRWLLEKPIAFLGTHNPAVSLRKIAMLLNRFGFADVVTPMEIYLHLRPQLAWRYWLGTKDDYAGATGLIDQARALWADQESERLFIETLLFRLEFDLDVMTGLGNPEKQYVDPTVPRWTEPLRMVDGGAYTGDTLQNMLQQNWQFQTVHAFEPDLENFRHLREAISAFPPSTEVSLWPCGLWSRTERQKFSEGGGTSSKLSETGAAEVPVVALDDVVHGPVNLIKLDIEGAEPEALQGARRLIEKNRPGLAVCLYHYPHHLWTIPLWVAGLDLGYRLYYRAHDQSTFETILYGVPK